MAIFVIRDTDFLANFIKFYDFLRFDVCYVRYFLSIFLLPNSLTDYSIKWDKSGQSKLKMYFYISFVYLINLSGDVTPIIPPIPPIKR